MVPILALLPVGIAGLAYYGSSAVEPLDVPSSSSSKTEDIEKKSDATFSSGGIHKVETTSQGMKVVANLFIPQDYREGQQRPAMIIAPAATAVKENATHKYAEKMSQLGWITLTFDPRGIGESEGPIECDCNPYHHANDLSIWVGFVASLPQVDNSKIFNAGVCAGALPAIFETFQDKRVKGLGLIVPSIVGSETMGGKWAPVRWIFYTIGGIVNLVASKQAVPAIPPPPIEDPWVAALAEYYLPGKIGHHPTWKNGIALASLPGIAAMYPYPFAKEYAGTDTPVFMATGDKAESFEPASRWWDLLKDDGTTRKEKLLIPNATHTEFYYKQDLIDESCVKMDAFFRKYF